MSDKSAIEWCEATWNPVTGCSKVSQGCKHCYAEREWPRLAAPSAKPNIYTGREFTDVRCHQEKLDIPLRWRKPRRIFVNSMSDLFHEDVLDSFIFQVLDVIDQAPQHVFQILTKRPQRAVDVMGGTSGVGLNSPPLRNLWLGVSCEDQATADERIPLLLQTPAAVRWVSAEPLLGPIDLWPWIKINQPSRWPKHAYIPRGPFIDWIVAGGESGPQARPMHPDWVRAIRDQCQAAGVPFFFKQWGEWAMAYGATRGHRVSINRSHGIAISLEPGRRLSPFETFGGAVTTMLRTGKKAAGRTLDGRTWDEYPA